MRALILLLILCPSLFSQRFKDDAFEFSFMPIPGMREVTAEEKVAWGLFPDLETAVNEPRGASETTKIFHHHLWVEFPATDVYRRQVEVKLLDEIPWSGPDEFRDSLRDQGLTIVSETDHPMPFFAKVVECELTRPDGIVMRQINVFQPRKGRWAWSVFQAYAADFEIVRSEIETSIESIRFQQEISAPPSSAAEQVLARGLQRDREGWGTLEVAGSLLLSVLVLASMVMTGKSAA